MVHYSIPDINELKSLQQEALPEVCDNLRKYIIDTVMVSGGHFAGNLGVIELTVALHYFFQSPENPMIWDVGHQSYAHKVLTGRAKELQNIRQYGGISGFPKLDESIHDTFGTGHSSTAISAALGLATGFSLSQQTQRKTIAIVGDGALTGGMSFEALNNLASSNQNILVIINDNHIGIDPNTGNLDRHLQNMGENSPNIFQNLGLEYTGPIDGHNIFDLLEAFAKIEPIKTPVILHIKTIKGKGYPPAENEQTLWHSKSKFVKIDSQKTKTPKWQDVFGSTLLALADKYANVCGITPAMPSGSGINVAMGKYPERFFDVGIAEQHAVTFSAGLALSGQVPYLNIYSTFLQRGYDQLIHDVALQKIPVVFCIDRAGLVGEDGPTHHGAFDISFLRPIPNLIISAPSNATELEALMHMAYQTKLPFCIRYPKGDIPLNTNPTKPVFGKGIQLNNGKTLAVVSTGLGTELAKEGIELSQCNVSHFHFPFIKPLDENLLTQIFNDHEQIITVEDGSITGGFGEGIAQIALVKNFKGTILHLGIPDAFIGHGENAILYKDCGFDPASIAASIKTALGSI